MGPSECPVQKGKGSSRWEHRRANISRRHGFTLVELLVVIVIIGILAAIITPVAFNALGNARNAAISLELSKLSVALEAYKNEYGSYPPDMTNRLHATRHLSRLFPRLHPHERDEFLELTLDPAEALVFWLRGFYPDPAHPLTGDSNHDEQPDMERGTAFYEFPLAQLTDIDGDNLPEYSPPYCKGTPVVYFDSRGNYQLPSQDENDPPVLKEYLPHPDAKIIGTASPYAIPIVPPPSINEIQFCESDSFQLISSGQDRHYSAWSNSQYKTYPEWNGQSVVYQSYTYENNNYDDDNITNFSNGKTLGSAE